jgi:hypothetical protein
MKKILKNSYPVNKKENGMKKTVVFLLVLSLVGGCAGVQKKFTRKKKEKKVASSIFIDEGPYQKQFSNDYYYKNHYTLWKSWHDELLDQLGGNQKKVSRAAQEAYNHLSEMGSYLVPEEKAKLDPEVKSLQSIVKQLESTSISKSSLGPLRVELEKIKRLVANDFYFNKVQDKIIAENVDLDEPAAQ